MADIASGEVPIDGFFSKLSPRKTKIPGKNKQEQMLSKLRRSIASCKRSHAMWLACLLKCPL